MVSETEPSTVMSSGCVDFAQHAWKKDVCCNCQRPRSEHVAQSEPAVDSGGDQGTDSPKPAKRNSVMTKSWIQGDVKVEQSEDDQWNSMCLPDPDQPNKRLDDKDSNLIKTKPLRDKDSPYFPEHCYEDIDGEEMKLGQRSNKESTKSSTVSHSYVNTQGHATITTSGNKTTISLNPEDRLNILIKDESQLPSNSSLHGRSRSSSREKSPVPAPKPKSIPGGNKIQPKDSEKTQKAENTQKIKKTKSETMQKVDKKGQRTISFVEKDPSVIGDDGGLDNLYSDNEDEIVDDNEPRESMEFSETEKEWALQALKNTLWNAEHGTEGQKVAVSSHSKEFEDINKVETLLKTEGGANTSDSETLSDTPNFGTFPLKKKSEKTVMDNMFSTNRLSTLCESSENVMSDIDDKYESMLKYLGADKFDFHSSPKRKSAIKGDNAEFDATDASYDDPWCDKFGLDSQSEMNLLDEIKGEIDLDSSSAGFALVDLLNDVLAKYSTGTPSETDSVKNMDLIDEKLEKYEKEEKKEGAEKNAEIEAKIVTLAANLRKHRAKGRAPRPPSCPPEPPQESAVSPAKQAALRAEQSKEPMFKMVPLGKSIGPNPLQVAAAQSGPVSKPDISSTSSSNSSENIDMGRSKNDKDKQSKKSGGIGGFFSRIFGRGKDADNDFVASSETLISNTWSMADPYVSSDSENQSERDSNSDKIVPDKGDNSKETKRASKASPQMKMKVLPTANRPVSPRPVERPPQQPEVKKDLEKEPSSSHKESPKPEVRTKVKDNVKTEKCDKNSSQKNVSTKPPEQSKSQLSPTKGDSKESPKAVSPKTKEAPPLPLNPPREITDASGAPKPRARGNSEGGPPRSRPRTRDFESKIRDTPNVPPPKPPVAVKPKAPVVQTKSLDSTDKTAATATKERLPSTSSLEETAKPECGQKKQETARVNDPKVLRKRAKSPKRFAAPQAPGRASLPSVLTDSNVSLASTSSEVSIHSLPSTQTEHKTEPKSLAFAKELEQKLQKEQPSASSESRKLAAPSAPSAAPPAPPSAKVDNSEKSKSLPVEKNKVIAPEKSKSLPAEVKNIMPKDNIPQAASSPKELTRKTSGSKDDFKTSPPSTVDDKSKTLPSSSSSTETEPASIQTSSVPSEVTIQPEKIELPKPAGNSRKSFLGKLNRSKNKPPPPPSVKRTKSITEASIAGDHQMKKIDLKDISGPVLITDMTNKAVSRRNTITIGSGDDNSFLSGGSTSSGSTSAGEKCDMSPHGSVENLYEFIKSEAPTPPTGDKKHFYDPVIDNNGGASLLRPPSMTGSEGYLEPVRSNQIQSEPVSTSMVESTISMGSMTTSFVSMTTNLPEMTKSTSENLENPYSRNDPGLDDLDISDERREILANQPIYEEITNGYGKLGYAGDGKISTEEPTQELYGVHNNVQNSHNSDQGSVLTSSIKKKDSFSSDSEISSASSSLSRPRPIPRKRPRPIGSGFEQYVAMNKPNVAVFLNEEQLREMLSKLTAMNLNTIKDIYTQHEKCFTKENLHLGSVGPLKWHDFDIYGKPLHTSEKAVIYSAKMRTTMSSCQIMLLHSRPEITAANHPSLLKPTCIFTDTVPFSYLTEEFIRTSQILETTSVNQSNANVAKCYIVVGLFDITESLTHHMNSLETICENQKEFLRKVLFFVLQLLSAISHCMEEGHSLSEADFHDLYLISNPYCLGETVSFLPQVRSPEDQRIDRVCLFLEKFLQDMCSKCDANSVLDDAAFFVYNGIQKVMQMLESRVAESLPLVRSYTEFLLWGPAETEPEFQDDRQSNLEPKLSMWLEKRRAELIHDFAKRVQRGTRCNIKDFYMMKFLLKASAGSLAECIRCHASTAGQH